MSKVTRRRYAPEFKAEAVAPVTPVVSTRGPSGPTDILAVPPALNLAPLNDPATLADWIRATLTEPPVIEDSVVARFAVLTVTESYKHCQRFRAGTWVSG